MSEIELLPCPFCGGKAALRRNRHSATFDTWIECARCHARTNSDDSVGGARNLWNHRHPDSTRPPAATAVREVTP